MKHNDSAEPVLDRALIGRIIKREIPRRRAVGTVQGLANASGVARSTIYRAIRDEDPKVEVGTFARIEAGLGLPTDALVTAGTHDLEGMVEVGCAAELVEWVRKEIAKSEAITDMPGASAI